MQRTIKYLLVSTFALGIAGRSLAADLYPARAPAPAPYAPAYPAGVPIWTGFYVGGNVGAGWSHGTVSDPAGNVFTPNSDAFLLGGAQVGYNYEFWRGAVIGIEADFDWAGNHNNTSNQAGGVTLTNNDRWLTTLTGRIGYAPWQRLLLYGKGGAAWVGSSDPTITNVATGASITPSTSNSNFGWTLGAGVEWAFWNNWSARLEYDFIGLTNRFIS
jgi:outer membrane immunogenic protein